MLLDSFSILLATQLNLNDKRLRFTTIKMWQKQLLAIKIKPKPFFRMSVYSRNTPLHLDSLFKDRGDSTALFLHGQ